MKCLSCLKSPCSLLPQRYVIATYLLIGLNVYFWIRVSVNLSLSEMTFPIKKDQSNDTKHQYCPAGVVHKINNTKAEFSWDQDIQHTILQGFYYGYLLSSIPGGILSDTFGGKTVLGIGFLLAALTCLVLPSLAKMSPYCFFVGRIVQGLGQGVVSPSMSSIVAKWAPPNERATMNGIIQTGAMLGNASGFIFSSFILATTPTWEDIYYINGSLGVVWVVGWYFICYSSPATHPFVSDDEKNIIESQLARNIKKKPKRIPWTSILTSLPFLAAVLANYAHLWAIFTMVNEMPQYLSKVVNFDIRKSGIFSATPHLSMAITAFGTGFVCDWLVRRGMSVTVNRRIFVFLSNFLPVPFMVAASVAGCDKIWVVILFALMMFFKGLAYATLKTQPVDLSPHYAGVLMGILNGIGSASGFVSPFVVTLFITGDGSLEQWRRFFILSGGIMIVFTLPFVCLGSGKIQPWNSADEEDSEEQTTNEQYKQEQGERSGEGKSQNPEQEK